MNRLAELDKLEELLKADGIPYERLDEDLTGRLSADAMKMLQEKGFYCKDFRHTVKIPNTKDKKLSVICQYGSYGYEQGLLEAWTGSGEPDGYMTAEDTMKWIKERWK